jgi:hypothetical protein
MNAKTGLIASLILNIAFLALIFYVKGNASSQAKKFVEIRINAYEKLFFEKDEVMLKNGLMWELVADLKSSSTKKQAVTFIKKFVASANAIVASKNVDEVEKAKSKKSKKAAKTLEEDFYNQPSGSTWTIGWGSDIKNSITIKFNKKKIAALNYDKLKI